MKNFHFVIIAALLVYSCADKQKVGSNGVVYTTPLEYNNYIMDRQKLMIDDISLYDKVSQNDNDSASHQLDKTVATISEGLKDVEGMPPFDNDSTLRNASVNLFSFYKKIFSEDFREMLAISKKITDSIQTEADITRFREIQESIAKNEGPLDEKMKEAQVTFAKNHNLILSDHSLQDKIDKMNKK